MVLRYSIILYVRNAGITGVNWLLRKLLLHNIDAMIKIALDNTAPCTRGAMIVYGYLILLFNLKIFILWKAKSGNHRGRSVLSRLYSNERGVEPDG